MDRIVWRTLVALNGSLTSGAWLTPQPLSHPSAKLPDRERSARRLKGISMEFVVAVLLLAKRFQSSPHPQPKHPLGTRMRGRDRS